jgi:hypothetical protein
MSTRRTTQVIAEVETKLPQQIFITQEIAEIEVKLAPFILFTQIIAEVEVELPYSGRTNSLPVQVV